VERIALVEVGVHPFAAFFHLAMVVRAGQRSQHEEGCLIGADFVFEEANILGDLFLRVPW
jgi:hypothetical protein